MIGAVVLAAGRSGRMGRQKLLLPLRDKPIIAVIVDELLRTALQPIVAVVGRDAEPIQEALTGREVSFVKNLDFDGDMLGSVRCGLRTLPPTCEAVLVVLGDQPGITAMLVNGLINAYHESGRSIVVPTHAGHRGHPVLIAARFRDEVLSRYDGIGLQGLLAAHPEEVFEFPVSSSAALEDMDTPADYEHRLKSSLG